MVTGSDLEEHSPGEGGSLLCAAARGSQTPPCKATVETALQLITSVCWVPTTHSGPT